VGFADSPRRFFRNVPHAIFSTYVENNPKARGKRALKENEKMFFTR